MGHPARCDGGYVHARLCPYGVPSVVAARGPSTFVVQRSRQPLTCRPNPSPRVLRRSLVLLQQPRCRRRRILRGGDHTFRVQGVGDSSRGAAEVLRERTSLGAEMMDARVCIHTCVGARCTHMSMSRQREGVNRVLRSHASVFLQQSWLVLQADARTHAPAHSRRPAAHHRSVLVAQL